MIIIILLKVVLTAVWNISVPESVLPTPPGCLPPPGPALLTLVDGQTASLGQ